MDGSGKPEGEATRMEYGWNKAKKITEKVGSLTF